MGMQAGLRPLNAGDTPASRADQYWARSWFSLLAFPDGQGNLGTLQTRLAQPGGSMFTLLLRDDAYGQGCKRHCYSCCHFRFDRQLHTANSSLMLDSQGMCLEEIFRPSSLHPPSKLNEAMLCASNGS
jgi:hypothetical protein